MHATAEDSAKLNYEEAGSGIPLIFAHEFVGGHRSWEPQIRFFSRFHRCIVYSARLRPFYGLGGFPGIEPGIGGFSQREVNPAL